MNTCIESRLPTLMAPAERLTPAEVAEQIARLGVRESLRRLLDSIPSLVLILNAQRQILLANSAVEKLAEVLQRPAFAGLRPGEFLACQHALGAEHGCGTTEACRTCGAVQAILEANAGRQSTMECRVATATGTAFDLRVTASPFAWQGREYAFLVIEDISDEKRRQLLERVFFHDVLNTAGSVSGIAALLADEPALMHELKDDLLYSAETLVGEIKSQRLLLAAENGALQPQPEAIGAFAALGNVRQLYRNHPVADCRQIDLATAGADCTLQTDPSILQRVLANMLKNALEATRAGGTVTLGAGVEAAACTFWCHNAGAIPREVALQIFQRSFTTKGRGRGIGTYSIKLLGEKYLGGEVGFTSTPEAGTRFQIRLPRRR